LNIHVQLLPKEAVLKLCPRLFLAWVLVEVSIFKL
jgi:hypothetical protein